jgi:DNA-binding transcriptional MocR family regulator
LPQAARRPGRWQQEIQTRSRARTAPGAGNAPATVEHAAPIDFAGGTAMRACSQQRSFAKSCRPSCGATVAALEYGDHQGYAPLRSTIAHVLASQGLPAQPGNVLVTAGSQQGLALVAQALLRPGDVVVVERPTYGGALDLFQSLDLKPVGVPVDEHGMQVEDRAFAAPSPKLIYTMPNFQNPTGAQEQPAAGCCSPSPVAIPADRRRLRGRLSPGGAVRSAPDPAPVCSTPAPSQDAVPRPRVGFLLAEGPAYVS